MKFKFGTQLEVLGHCIKICLLRGTARGAQGQVFLWNEAFRRITAASCW